MTTAAWPALDYGAWKNTYATLHMWTQVVGKIALAQAPPLNHSWSVAMLVTARGLSTRTLPHGDRSFTMEFDFIDHRLVIRTSDGSTRDIVLAPMAVADFYRSVMDALGELRLPVKIWTTPVEVAAPIAFEQDTIHHTYDAAAAQRAWHVLRQVERVLNDSRCSFVGKCSPVHFFWGAFDLAVTRFSGRPAPPREGPAFMREAYSHEVISHGFWPGNDQLPEAAFYGYAVPEPAGFKDVAVEPRGAYYHPALGEFILPYNVVRQAADPAVAIQQFIANTYQHAATLGWWDRQALERT
jgi:hypothetical protein